MLREEPLFLENPSVSRGDFLNIMYGVISLLLITVLMENNFIDTGNPKKVSKLLKKEDDRLITL